MSETDKTGSGQPENNQPRADQPGAENAPANDPEPAAESVADDAIPDEASSAEPPGERDYEAEIAELNDRLLRTLAEGENLRRRAQREREETSKYAIAGFARDVLGVADNLRRALDALPEAAQDNDGEGLKSFIEGVELTEREFLGILERQGVEKIDPAGEKFDHNLHEALFEVPTTEAAPGTVVQVIQAGFVLKGRLLRAAQVGIAKHPPEAPPPEPVDTTV